MIAYLHSKVHRTAGTRRVFWSWFRAFLSPAPGNTGRWPVGMSTPDDFIKLAEVKYHFFIVNTEYRLRIIHMLFGVPMLADLVTA